MSTSVVALGAAAAGAAAGGGAAAAAVRVAVVDCGLGNLFSVRQACAAAGMDAELTSSPADVDAAAAVILPGVGAFEDAMRVLRERALDEAIRRAAAAGKLVVGICLGMQLLATESEEFGRHAGLGIIPGRVTRLPDGMRTRAGLAAKVPEIGWNAIRAPSPAAAAGPTLLWEATPLAGLADGTSFYFVHSFIVTPAEPGVVLSTTTYGDVTYCSSMGRDNVFGFQFHPERSGPAGLRLYANIAAAVRLRAHAHAHAHR